MVSLFDPLRIGAWSCPNRIVMAPLTRCRASAGRVPNALMAGYYADRADAGLILTEATAVTPMGVGYPDTPGIWSPEQIACWKMVVEAVHARGGRILMQLWHVGRISHPEYLNGELPVAPSAKAPAGEVSLLRPKRSFVTPRALRSEEIPELVAAYRQGAANALAAGFDGVEIHAANGYLIDQFLQDSSNLRSDDYGGSIAKRARFLLEITDAVVGVWGADRVGVHLAPRGDAHDMGDSDPAGLFGYVATALGNRRIAFICTREHRGEDSLSPMLKEKFGGVLIANEGFDRLGAEAWLSADKAMAVAFGRDFIANADLVTRLSKQAPLNKLDMKTMYGYGLPDPRVGYTDYPLLEAEQG